MSVCDTTTSLNSMMALEKAKAMMLDKAIPSVSYEVVTLQESLGRVLAEDIKSPLNIPLFDNSAMDGYAFCASDVVEGEPLHLIGESFAGHPFDGEVTQGQCVRIMTGAKLPLGCDSVIMQEQVTRDGNVVLFNKSVSQGQCVRTKAHEFQQGQIVATRGEAISSRHIALLASLGIHQLTVYQQITVAIFSTGDELIELGTPLTDGQIYDSNRYSLIAQLKKMNCRVIDLGVIGDDPVQIEQAFINADNMADVVISSGGVSVGEADFTKDVLAELGDIEFWKVAIKPGKPLAFGYLKNSVFLGLPGNPVSAMVTFDQVAKPIIRKLSGANALARLRLQATCLSNLRKNVGRMEFQRGFAKTSESGDLEVVSTGDQGSGMVGSMCNGNCYIVLLQEQGNVAKGEKVMIELFDNNLLA